MYFLGSVVMASDVTVTRDIDPLNINRVSAVDIRSGELNIPLSTLLWNSVARLKKQRANLVHCTSSCSKGPP